MADSPRRPAARSSQQRNRAAEEMPEDAGPPAARGQVAGAGRGVEADFDAPAAFGLAAAVQSAAAPDSFVPPDDFFAARDALLARLGGFDGLATAFAASEDQTGGENIVGVGVGLRFAGGTLTGEPAVKVFVREKLPLAAVAQAQQIPKTLEGVPTDVEAVGEAIPYSYARRYDRPVKCGASCGHHRLPGSGTLGAVVILENGRLAILGNNHVLANENDAAVGDKILQPGRAEPSPAPDEAIGLLEDFVPIQATGNRVDAAVAWTNRARVSPAHMTYTLSPGPVAPALGMTVLKNGRTTQSTVGVVTDMGFTVRVGYRPFPSGAAFVGQLVVRGVSGPFSKPGDSGALIVTAGTKQPVALLFAGSNDTTVTYANPIAEVIRALRIREFVNA